MAADISSEAVLDAAHGLLRRGGVDGLSMRRLADELGVSYQVVYSRVGGKADVVRALHGRWFAELSARMGEFDPPDPDAWVHAVAREYLRRAVEDPLRFAVMFGSPVAEFVRDDAAREVEWVCFQRTWLAASRAWCDANLVPNPSGAWLRLGWRLWTAVHGITSVHLAGHGSPAGDPLVEVQATIDLLLRATLDDPSAA